MYGHRKVICKITDKNNEHPKLIKHPDDIDYYCVEGSSSAE